MEVVVTYLTKTPTPQLPVIQMSTLPNKMTTGQAFLKKVMDEFICCWGLTSPSTPLWLLDQMLLKHQRLDLLLPELQFPDL